MAISSSEISINVLSTKPVPMIGFPRGVMDPRHLYSSIYLYGISLYRFAENNGTNSFARYASTMNVKKPDNSSKRLIGESRPRSRPYLR